MKILAEILPLALTATIVILIVGRRLGAVSAGGAFRRGFTRVRPEKKKPATVLQFDRTKLDDELNALLRKRR